ncbi:MAG: outer membrane protein assembly factor BamB family protein, partial [Thermoguttaceae bacterium]
MSLKRRLVFDNSVLIEWLGPIVFIATAFLAQPAPLELQINALHAATIAEEPAKNVFLPPDRHTLQKLLHAKLLLAKGLYSEAVENLGSILDSPEDYFFQYQQDQPIYRSLKSEAQRLIGQMPLEGRELYELQYGSQAKKLLETAVASPNLEFLQQVSRRYFHTQAGYEATFLLGLRQLDHGQALAGAYTLQRLIDHSTSRDQFEPALSLGAAMGWMQAGKPEKTREIMANFCQRRRQAKWKAEAERIPQFKNDSEAFDWLHQLVARQNISKNVQPNSWLIHGGNPQHNPVTVSGSPFLNLCWHMPLADDPLIQDVWDQKRRYYLEQEIPFLPNLHPLVVDDVLLMRTYKNLLAVDFNSGKRLWEAPADDFPEKLLLGENEANPLAESMAVLLSNRRSNNTNFGKLSSDGRLVFCIEDFDLSDGEKAFFGTTRQRLNIKTLSDPPTDNRLAAYDIHTGKLTWQLGGDTQEFGVRLPETFFLGPPLPLMGKLYVLAQRKSEIYLFVLNPANGTTCWSQQLAIVEDDAQMDSIRRCTGISPSYAAEILVCPTSSGALTAVDLASESLLWGFPYVRYNPVVGISMAAPLIFSSRPKSARLFRAAGGVCICESRVLAAPPDSDTLYCLNLTNGESYWNYKLQDEDVYVGCVAKGKVFLVGRHQVRALNLSDGKLAWDGRTVALPEGAMPSGQGFCAGDSYFLPLDSAEVAEINLTEGKLAHLYESRGGFVPGNLICCKGRVISQGNEGVDVFYQLDAAKNEVRRRLANDPSDAKGLCLQGEIFLESGNRVKAIDCFRRAYSANGDLHSRELLCDTLLEGLEKEFAVYRRHSDEIEHLLDNPGQRAAYLRLMAVGLQEEGDLASAFAHYLKLIDLESNKLPMETLSKTLSVRCDRGIIAEHVTVVLD